MSSADEKETSTAASNGHPKIKLSEWTSTEKCGDLLDWLKMSLYIINLEKGSMSDGQVVQLVLSAINAPELKMKIITELRKNTDKSKNVIENFEDIFKNTVKRDTFTYRNNLKKLKYSEDSNMKEFYSRIYGLTAKAMDLDEETDKTALQTLAMNEFIAKIPAPLRQAMQSVDYDDGYKMAEAAEKIRSFNRLYLHKNTELNNFQPAPTEHFPPPVEFNQAQGQSQYYGRNNFNNNFNRPNFNNRPPIRCNYCQKIGHKYAECRSLQRDHNMGNYRTAHTNNILALPPPCDQNEGLGDVYPFFSRNDQ